MGRRTIEELRNQRVKAMTSAERAEFEEALASAHLAIRVGETGPRSPRGSRSQPT